MPRTIRPGRPSGELSLVWRAEPEFVEATKKPGTNAQAKVEGFRGFRTTCDGSVLLLRVRRCPAAASTAARALSLHQRCQRFAVASGPQSLLANRSSRC